MENMGKGNRREFLKNSTKTSFGFFFLLNLERFPNSSKVIQRLIDEASDESYRNLLLSAAASQSYKEMTSEELLKAYNTQFWINCGEGTQQNIFTESIKENIRKQKTITDDDLQRACNRNTGGVITDALPVINDFMWDTVAAVGIGKLALTTRSPVSALVLTGALSGALILNKEFIKGIFQKVERENSQLCTDTVNKYKNLNDTEKLLLESEEVQDCIKIPFKKGSNEILESLPKDHLLRKAKETTITSNNTTTISNTGENKVENEILKNTIKDLNSYLEEWKKYVSQAKSEKERQVAIDQINFQNEENKASIYLVKTFIELVLGNKSFASDFYKVAMSINEMHYSFAQFTLPVPAIGTMAMTANWVSASLMIMSVLQGSGETNVWKELFKQLRQLTEIVIEGFKVVQENQKKIIENLQNLFDFVILNGKTEHQILSRIESGMNQIQQTIKFSEYNGLMQDIFDANSQLSALFNHSFDIKKESHANQLRIYINKFVQHSTIKAVNFESMSGRVPNVDGKLVQNYIVNNIPFEYQIGLIPLVLSKLNGIHTPVRVADYANRVANPIEWLRGIELYLQAYYFAKPQAPYVSKDIDSFLNAGKVLIDFLKDFSSIELFIPIKNSFGNLADSIANDLAIDIEVQLRKKMIPEIISLIRNYNKSPIFKLDREIFKNVNSRGTQSTNWNLERDILLSRLSGGKNKYFVNEFDTYYEDEPLYTIDYDIYALINIAEQLKILSHNQRPSEKGHDPKFTYHTLTILKGPFKDLEFKFVDRVLNVAGKPHLGPFYEFRQIGFALVNYRYGGKYYPLQKVANYSWRDKARELMGKSKIDDSYFKIEPSYDIPFYILPRPLFGPPPKNRSSLGALNFTFVEFLLNELLHEFQNLKSQASDLFRAGKSQNYERFESSASSFNMMGYLQMNMLTIKNYNSQSSVFKDYADIKATGIPFRFTPVSLPFISFFDDLVEMISAALKMDLLNERITISGREEYNKFISSFSDNQDLKPIISFTTKFIKDILEKQNATLLEVMQNADTSNLNFNIVLKIAFLELLQKEICCNETNKITSTRSMTFQN